MNDYAVDTAIAIKWVVSELDSALVDEALRLACTYGIAVYYALFVALVKKHGCGGITADEPLVAKVGKDFPSIKLLKNWQPSP